MTLRRAALYVGGATLLAAWFSSAASLSLHRASRSPATERSQAPSATDDLAAEMQQQTKRLREHLASAPIPQQPLRNPFVFRSAVPKPRLHRPVAVDAAPPPMAAIPEAPALTLIGIAEHKRPQGLVRTAMIATAGEELILAAVGDAILHRYKVTAIGHDTVELTDVSTGQTLRISLQ